MVTLSGKKLVRMTVTDYSTVLPAEYRFTNVSDSSVYIVYYEPISVCWYEIFFDLLCSKLKRFADSPGDPVGR